MMRLIIGTLLVGLLGWVALWRDEKKVAQEVCGLRIGVVHAGAVYATDSSLAVYRGQAIGAELRVCRIAPADPLGQVSESLDFPPRWKLGNGMLMFVNANPQEGRSRYGYHARAFYTYGIPLAQIDKRLADERRAIREKNDPLAATLDQEFGDCLVEDKDVNLLHAIFAAIVP
jgi:hypothetical protein